MATTDFSLGVIAKVDRDNRTHKTKDGQWIVVVKTSDNDKKADLEVFDSEDDAKKAAAEVLVWATSPVDRTVAREHHLGGHSGGRVGLEAERSSRHAVTN